MELKLSHEEGYVLASTAGSIDDSAKGPFRECLHSLIAQPGTKVVLDLSQSNLITSQGIGHLVALVANANLHNSRVVLAGCSSFVAIVLARCKLDRFFELAETTADAICRVFQEPHSS
jgi:anti-anti-sigma factor